MKILSTSSFQEYDAQWGLYSVTGELETLTFPISFVNTPFVLIGERWNSKDNEADITPVSFDANSFNVNPNDKGEWFIVSLGK